MNILLTGASSFTGLWFARALHARGNHVVTTLRSAPQIYAGSSRGARVEELQKVAEVIYNAEFGSAKFTDLVATRNFEVLCHHAADVTNYRSPDFDVAAALANNTLGVQNLLRTMSKRGLKAIVSTGSVFEPGEGSGESPLRAFSPYGLSKSFTDKVNEFWANHFGIPYGKFVIPNPFGAFEEPRFTSYLMKTWARGESAEIKTPLYIRDNIHVDALSLIYAEYVLKTAAIRVNSKISPSMYAESQGAFAARVAKEISVRSGLDCALTLRDQAVFDEPTVRINHDRVDFKGLGWDEERAWDQFATYYNISALA